MLPVMDLDGNITFCSVSGRVKNVSESDSSTHDVRVDVLTAVTVCIVL
jgi:hypothetical protein